MAEENKEVLELTQQELSEQNRIRREKLAQMQEEGKDPFQIVKYDVTHHSDEIKANFDELERVHKLWGEEIDRLRRVVTELQTNRFTMGEIQNMIRKYLESFEPSSGSLNF